jgi:hypothetical protein
MAKYARSATPRTGPSFASCSPTISSTRLKRCHGPIPRRPRAPRSKDGMRSSTAWPRCWRECKPRTRCSCRRSPSLAPTLRKSTWGIHDLVKTQHCIFNGYGHIHQDYRKVDGEWKITGSHTSRLFVDEQWALVDPIFSIMTSRLSPSCMPNWCRCSCGRTAAHDGAVAHKLSAASAESQACPAHLVQQRSFYLCCVRV